MRSRDTTPEAHEIQMAAFRSMSPSQRLESAVQTSEMLMEMAINTIRRRHPDYDEQEARWAYFRMRHGDDLFRRVWPKAPLLSS